jgi:hypothetical protein
MSEMPYIIAAYATTWIVLLGFASYLIARQRAARRISHAARREV